ncbi:MAG TPA: hypothetical protein VF704_07995 [Allosphingosinicella sp.]|jgi:hypothetical protein
MEVSRRTLLIAGVAFVAACDGGDGTLTPAPPPPPPPPAAQPVTLNFSFANDFAGWETGYTDFTQGQEEAIDFRFGHERLPAPLEDRTGIFLSGNNAPDDLFMYIFRRLDGLVAGQSYRVDTRIAFATNAPQNCAGVGGQPGESVWIKAGASNVAPARVAQAGGYVASNIDKGDQIQDGEDMKVLGNFAQPEPGGDCLAPAYALKTLDGAGNGPVVTSDAQGRLWLVIGTESGFEAVTRIYYLDGTITLTPV